MRENWSLNKPFKQTINLLDHIESIAYLAKNFTSESLSSTNVLRTVFNYSFSLTNGNIDLNALETLNLILATGSLLS